MAHFRFIRRKRSRFINFLSNFMWTAFILITLFLSVIVLVCYDGDIAASEDVFVIQNRQTLEEKEGLQSKEEELLGMAAKLEKELFEHQERIKHRLETLGARKKGLADRRVVGNSRHPHRVEGRGTEHRPERRLMDARSSRGLGSDGGGGGGGRGGDGRGQTSSDAIETATRMVQSIPRVKDRQTNKTDGVFRSALKNGAQTKAEGDVNPPSAKPPLEKPHITNNLGSYNVEVNTYQSIKLRTKLKSLHGSRKPNNQTKGNSSDKHLIKSKYVNKDAKDSLAHSQFQHAASQKTISVPLTDPDQEGVATVTVSESDVEPVHLGCRDLAHVNSREQIGSGYTKQVEKVELGDGRWVAVKTVWTQGQDVSACLEMGMKKRDCVQLANYKLMKEIALLQQLHHPNIIKLLGFCIKDDEPTGGSDSMAPSSSTIVERGTPITFIDILQMPWEDRLRICLGVSRLMVSLSESPLGSLAVHDFKLSQFVLVDGEIKLSDLDDVDDNLPSCSSTTDCGVELGTNNTVFVACRNGVCSDYSVVSNMAQAYLKFFVYLQLDPPPGMGDLVGEFINNTKRASWSPRRCLQHIQMILDYYQQGKYIEPLSTFNFSDTNYKVYRDHTLPDGDDYWCPGTRRLAAACVLSVHDEHEAIRMCLRDRQCGAIVLSSKRTWTGRYLVSFKRGFSKVTQPSKGNTVYIFPT